MTRPAGQMTRSASHMTKSVRHMTKSATQIPKSAGQLTRLAGQLTNICLGFLIATTPHFLLLKTHRPLKKKTLGLVSASFISDIAKPAFPLQARSKSIFFFAPARASPCNGERASTKTCLSVNTFSVIKSSLHLGKIGSAIAWWSAHNWSARASACSRENSAPLRFQICAASPLIA